MRTIKVANPPSNPLIGEHNVPREGKRQKQEARERETRKLLYQAREGGETWEPR
jgi:hypothetical protein